MFGEPLRPRSFDRDGGRGRLNDTLDSFRKDRDRGGGVDTVFPDLRRGSDSGTVSVAVRTHPGLSGPKFRDKTDGAGPRTGPAQGESDKGTGSPSRNPPNLHYPQVSRNVGPSRAYTTRDIDQFQPRRDVGEPWSGGRRSRRWSVRGGPGPGHKWTDSPRPAPVPGTYGFRTPTGPPDQEGGGRTPC